MMRTPRKRGFTLVEMLVVIAIIVVLMAILFPVFQSVRRKARETQCISNLNQLGIALKEYKSDHGRYPSEPYYDPVDQRYKGGLSDLYPDYIDNTELFICPDDINVKGMQAQTQQNAYSSYNGVANNPRGGDWTLTTVLYNYNGYDFAGAPGAPVTSNGIDNGGGVDTAYFAVLMQEYGPKGLRRRAAPRLKNRNCPGNTIITHCIQHHGRGTAEKQKEFVLRVDGSVANNVMRSSYEEDPDGPGPKIAPWISQLR